MEKLQLMSATTTNIIVTKLQLSVYMYSELDIIFTRPVHCQIIFTEFLTANLDNFTPKLKEKILDRVEDFLDGDCSEELSEYWSPLKTLLEKYD